jgi:putative transcriptional regulator
VPGYERIGGLRKLRFADTRRGKGKRGGLRVIHFYWDRIDHAEKAMTRKRDLFAELTEGFDALADRRAGKRTPRTNVRTLENWEQGRARPNAQAALLIRLVQRFPDTVQLLAKI